MDKQEGVIAMNAHKCHC